MIYFLIILLIIIHLLFIVFLKLKYNKIKNSLNRLKNAETTIKKQKEELIAKNRSLETNNQELNALNEELEMSYQEINRISVDLENVIDIVSKINAYSFENRTTFFSNLLETIINLLPEVDFGTVFLVKDSIGEIIDTHGHNLEKLKTVKLYINKFPEFDDFHFINDFYNFLNNITNDNIKDDFSKIFKPIKKSILMKFNNDDKFVGGIFLDIEKNSENDFSKRTQRIIDSFGNMASAFFSIQNYNILQNNFQKEIIISITQLLDIHDSYTKGHSQGVAEISKKIAEEFNIKENIVKKIYWAGIVHDIGKILIPTTILNKSSKLTTEEFEEIKKHPVYGYKAIANSPELSDVANFVLYHHERWDGQGYPHGLKEEEIPLASRILAIADAWDAMRTDRSYRKKLTKEEARNQIIKNVGKQFCPKVCEIFIKNIDIIDKYYE